MFPKEWGQTLINRIIKLDKLVQNKEVECGFVINYTTGDVGEPFAGDEQSKINLRDSTKTGVSIRKNDVITTVHTHLNNQPPNDGDFKAQFSLKGWGEEMITDTPDYVYKINFKKNYSQKTKKTIVNKVAQLEADNLIENGSGEYEKLWKKYINDKTLNKYLEFDKIEKKFK